MEINEIHFNINDNRFIIGSAQDNKTEFIKKEFIPQNVEIITQNINYDSTNTDFYDKYSWFFNKIGGCEVPHIIIDDEYTWIPVYGTWKQVWQTDAYNKTTGQNTTVEYEIKIDENYHCLNNVFVKIFETGRHKTTIIDYCRFKLT